MNEFSEPVFELFDSIGLEDARREYLRSIANGRDTSSTSGARVFGQTGRNIDVTVKEYTFPTLLAEIKYPRDARVRMAKAEAKRVLLDGLHRSIDEVVLETLGRLQQQAEVCNCADCRRRAREMESWKTGMQ